MEKEKTEESEQSTCSSCAARAKLGQPGVLKRERNKLIINKKYHFILTKSILTTGKLGAWLRGTLLPPVHSFRVSAPRKSIEVENA